MAPQRLIYLNTREWNCLKRLSGVGGMVLVGGSVPLVVGFEVSGDTPGSLSLCLGLGMSLSDLLQGHVYYRAPCSNENGLIL